MILSRCSALAIRVVYTFDELEKCTEACRVKIGSLFLFAPFRPPVIIAPRLNKVKRRVFIFFIDIFCLS